MIGRAVAAGAAATTTTASISTRRGASRFVACDGNATLLVVDLRTGRVTGRFRVGDDDPDVLDFDAGLRRLYVAAESGVVAVFAERRRKLVKLGQALLARGAHSVAVDPRTH